MDAAQILYALTALGLIAILYDAYYSSVRWRMLPRAMPSCGLPAA